MTTKTVIITGASSGIGLALARAFAARGARIVANARTITSAGTLTASPTLALVDGDIASPIVAAKVVDAAERLGGVDLLVNNAGVFIARPFTDYSAEEYEALVSTNLTGFLHVTQLAVKRMRQRKAGHVVTITTSLADQPIAGVSASIPILTKAGLNGVTKALAIEHAGEGIRFNTVAPGMIDTPMHKPESHGFLKQMHPIARMGTTAEVVDAVLYLDDAPFVSGEVLHVDGGAHAGRW
ncbi:MAG TPA: SDR family oxidoreductase [Vicinamibacterales bacterium]|nr:SDR family oxidoreductase [Vicinamibacterales bacterium]